MGKSKCGCFGKNLLYQLVIYKLESIYLFYMCQGSYKLQVNLRFTSQNVYIRKIILEDNS